MTSTLIFASFVSAGLSFGASQTPTPQTPPTPAVPGAMVTVVGCLTTETTTPKEAPMPGASPGARAGDAVTYVLTDQAPPATASGGIIPVSQTGSRSSGATASGIETPARKMYVLRTQGDALDLSKHVNHTVRVTGATTAPMTTAPLAGRSTEATPTQGVTAPAGSTGTPFDTANLPTLAVTSLTMVSATCK